MTRRKLHLVAAVAAAGAIVPAQAAHAAAYGFEKSFGSPGTANGQLKLPLGVAVDPVKHRVYVTDSGNDRVQEFKTSGAFVAAFGAPGTGRGKFNFPTGIAVDAKAGRVYVADGFGGRIEVFKRDGSFVRKWGSPGSGKGQFNVPVGVAVGHPSSGTRIYVADSGNNRVQEFKTDGTFVRRLTRASSSSDRLSHPSGVAVDPVFNDVYVADTGNDRVVAYRSSGSYAEKWGGAGAGRGKLSGPMGIAVGSGSNGIVRISEYVALDVWVADTGNGRLQAFDSSGPFLSLLGSPGSGFDQMSQPTGVAVDLCTSIAYVADSKNDRIDKYGIQPLASCGRLAR